ncbi:NAD(P)-binding domain-containing protein [Corynebacterium sp. zg-331]|uniref:NADPH-dependent F420 reductase n=1 Tax=unclassified Corynebacterium TaxID=2624378 RepID=UPI00128B1F08|nr:MULTISPECIES: NAD(P)-binding domain-containing protein [unclassified Corynebacterium]MBC3185287.1 NAD(P)-binding domain-containing protein [Corynebacterium sp. zg-331]MPV51784.1 NADP oxidoreductase [Corynebacterium sp. zg331]
MNKIGIIGSGAIGEAIARLAVAAGLSTTMANSRGPASLDNLIRDIGPRAHAGTVQEAAAAEIVVLAVPLTAYPSLPTDALRDTIVLSTGNYYPSRDGRIPVLDSLQATTAQYEQSLLPGARVVKAFNNIVAHHIPLLAHSAPRTALPIFGDEPAAKDEAITLIHSLGFDTVDGGELPASWRAEPESGAYTETYAADHGGFAADYLADRGRPVPTAELEEILASAHRPDVAARRV